MITSYFLYCNNLILHLKEWQKMHSMYSCCSARDCRLGGFAHAHWAALSCTEFCTWFNSDLLFSLFRLETRTKTWWVIWSLQLFSSQTLCLSLILLSLSVFLSLSQSVCLDLWVCVSLSLFLSLHLSSHIYSLLLLLSCTARSSEGKVHCSTGRGEEERARKEAESVSNGSRCHLQKGQSLGVKIEIPP